MAISSNQDHRLKKHESLQYQIIQYASARKRVGFTTILFF